jgi:uncharacterized protein YbcI
MTTFEERPPEEAEGHQQMMTRLSDEMTRLYKEQFGRGPTRVRSHFAGPDTVVVVLEESFTPAERNLAAMGEHQRLRDVRLFFQYASEDVLTATVERIIGRRVRAFISGIDASKDISSEVFVLDPRQD